MRLGVLEGRRGRHQAGATTAGGGCLSWCSRAPPPTGDRSIWDGLLATTSLVPTGTERLEDVLWRQLETDECQPWVPCVGLYGEERRRRAAGSALSPDDEATLQRYVAVAQDADEGRLTRAAGLRWLRACSSYNPPACVVCWRQPLRAYPLCEAPPGIPDSAHL